MKQIPLNELELYKFCPHCSKNLTAKQIDKEKVKICVHCGFIFWNKSKPVASIVLHKNGKVLLIQRANEPFKGFWVLPGGFISYKETAEEAIKREAREELGAKVKLERVIGTYLIDNDPRGMHLDIIFCGTTDDEIKISNEDVNWHYFSPDELPEYIAYKHKDSIIDWYKRGNKYG